MHADTGMTENMATSGTLVGSVLIGGYQVVRLIGRGGMGTVYEALKLPLNNRVAVKVMASNLDPSAQGLQRFRREAEITSNLGHPHIVQVFDFGTTPSGDPFLVMEYLKGEDLLQRMLRVGRLTPLQALSIVKQVASALAAAHANDVVHRDLKPANIFILDVEGESDFVKLVDFGISKVRSGPIRLTQDAARVGTPSYMSPEQALGQIDEIDGRTDQWALACIAWEAISGAVPFVGEDSNAVLFQVVNVDPPPLSARIAGIRPEIEQVLRRALCKNKLERFPGMSELALALESAVNGVANGAKLARTAHLFVPPERTTEELPEVLITPAPAAPTPSGSHRAPGGGNRTPSTGGHRTSGAGSGRPAGTGGHRPPSPHPESTTTFSQSSGELNGLPGHPLLRSKPLWIAIGATAVVVLAGGLLLRSPKTGSAAHVPASSSPPTEKPRLPAFVEPALAPPPSLPPPAPPSPVASPPPSAATPIARRGRAVTKAAIGKNKRAPTHKGPSLTPFESDGATTAPPRPKIETNLIKEL